MTIESLEIIIPNGFCSYFSFADYLIRQSFTIVVGVFNDMYVLGCIHLVPPGHVTEVLFT